MRSDYHIDRIIGLSRAGHITNGSLFFAGLPSQVRTLDAQLEGSGANALHAAIALCDEVDVYGMGLYSHGVGADKLYVHGSDAGVGQCAGGGGDAGGQRMLKLFCINSANTSGGSRTRAANVSHDELMAADTEPCGLYFRPHFGRKQYRQWLKDRIHAELLAHVMSAMGIFSWRSGA